MNKKILITGATGLVGSRFVELNEKKEELLTPSLEELDIVSDESVKKYLSFNNPDIIINFAAHTNLNEAETQRDDKDASCYKVNVVGVENIINNLSIETRFIQISSDQGFTGTSDNPGPYDEDSIPESDSKKIGWYAFTKAEAERKVVEKLGNKATILRLIYPFRSKYDDKLDFLRKPLSLYDQGKLYPMFSDQQISVVFIDDVCKTVEKIVDLDKCGIFHSSSSDTGSPFEIVSYMLEKTRGVTDAVIASSLDEFLKTVDNPVRYPKFGGLKVEKTENELGIKFGSWREMVDNFVSQL